MAINTVVIINEAFKLFVYAYNGLVNLLQYILQETVFKANPTLANTYGNAIALLVSLTAIYLLLVFVSAFKKVLGVLIAIGWVLLIVAIILNIH
ncbi:MAG: hypothetical protein RQ838_01525 [Caldivirga sp.]|jgi:hypothetical protein|uniref:hypothetical protein n=1 Tax=Caldivirga sp. MU80 TaxID=1650354 RepID=UPI0007467ECD|nr:hypothetical protein [Caldivirga sp. MU80]KUO86495.1 MAG: hypothetical protein AT709_06665 [Caldivirga sp. MG_3]KUO90190.1 MAG: hypothetical protein AT713_03900 [Caldivirga sp. JCHS_4]MDT7902726.1 hypothetical protein [Caldivirga sp.]NAZ29369.1 hypothetical protein [Caldivirga sp.]